MILALRLGAIRIGEAVETADRPIGVLVHVAVEQRQAGRFQPAIEDRIVEVIQGAKQARTYVLRRRRVFAGIVVLADRAVHQPRFRCDRDTG